MKGYAYLISTSQTSTRGTTVGNTGQNFDAQQVFLNTFENIINRRVDIPEDIQRFQNIYVPDHIVTLAQDGTIPNMGWPNKELTTLSLLRPKIP